MNDRAVPQLNRYWPR